MKLHDLAAAAALALHAVPVIALAQAVIDPVASLEGDGPGTISFWGDGYAAATATWEDWLFVGVPRESAVRDGSVPPTFTERMRPARRCFSKN